MLRSPRRQTGRGGFRPQAEGKAFEATFESIAQLSGLRVISVPEAGRWIGPGAFKPIPGMCDFILINQEGKAAFVDTKSVDDIVFKYSLVDANQLKQLKSVGDLCPAGYVVCFRPIGRVIFFPWHMLERIQPRESIIHELGFDLGPLGFFRPDKIFACKGPEFVDTIDPWPRKKQKNLK